MDEFLTKLRDFERAAYALLETWERLDHTGDYFAGDYPFDKSFEDVCSNIVAWREQSAETAGRIQK